MPPGLLPALGEGELPTPPLSAPAGVALDLARLATLLNDVEDLLSQLEEWAGLPQSRKAAAAE